jgi:hypothetical protein
LYASLFSLLWHVAGSCLHLQLFATDHVVVRGKYQSIQLALYGHSFTPPPPRSLLADPVTSQPVQRPPILQLPQPFQDVAGDDVGAASVAGTAATSGVVQPLLSLLLPPGATSQDALFQLGTDGQVLPLPGLGASTTATAAAAAISKQRQLGYALPPFPSLPPQLLVCLYRAVRYWRAVRLSHSRIEADAPRDQLQGVIQFADALVAALRGKGGQLQALLAVPVAQGDTPPSWSRLEYEVLDMATSWVMFLSSKRTHRGEDCIRHWFD